VEYREVELGEAVPHQSLIGQHGHEGCKHSKMALYETRKTSTTYGKDRNRFETCLKGSTRRSEAESARRTPGKNNPPKFDVQCM
jgi:hypothetical protein